MSANNGGPAQQMTPQQEADELLREYQANRNDQKWQADTAATVRDLLKANGLKTQDEQDALMVKLANDRRALLDALKVAIPELEYMSSGFTHAEWKTAEARKALASALAAIAQAEAK